MKLYGDERITPAGPHRRQPARSVFTRNAAPIYFDNPAWMAQGVCAQTDPEAFFPERGGAWAAAIRICQQCPVRAVCLQYALDHDERIGIWGATTANQRKAMRRERAA